MRAYSAIRTQETATPAGRVEVAQHASNAATQEQLSESHEFEDDLGFLDGLDLGEGSGSLLEAALSEAFGQDVSGVKTRAASATEVGELNARAFCEGSSVCFGPEVDPTNLRDRRSMETVAHEFAHALAPNTSPVHEVDRPGDRGETLADLAGATFGAWIAGGGVGPVPSLAPATGGQARIQRETKDEGPLANEFRENELSGVCAAVPADQELLMDGFVADAGAMFDVWSGIRDQSDPDFDSNPLEERLRRFYCDWMQLPSNLDDAGNPVAFHGSPAAIEELSRRLNTGLIPGYLKEIRMFNWPELTSYVRLLGVEDETISHNYELIMTASLSGGAGEVIVGEAEIVSHEIRYTNSLGMTWSQATRCGKAGGGVGASTIPVSVNVASGLGESVFNAGVASTHRYFAPDFFDAAILSYVGGEALVGGGGSFSAVIFTNGFRSIEFDTSGAIGRLGTDDAGAVSATLGLGACWYPTTADGVVMPPPTQSPEQDRSGQWVPLIEAGVFFQTGDASLDGDDMATVARVASAVHAHDVASPGESFRVAVVGRSSNRWRGRTGQSSPEELNGSLAGARADAVEAALAVELGDVEADITPGVFSESMMLALVGAARGTDPDDNGQVDRSVQIAVLYNPCGTDGEVSQ